MQQQKKKKKNQENRKKETKWEERRKNYQSLRCSKTKGKGFGCSAEDVGVRECGDFMTKSSIISSSGKSNSDLTGKFSVDLKGTPVTPIPTCIDKTHTILDHMPRNK